VHNRRVLFICKRGGIYGGVYGEGTGRRSSGLKVSAGFVVNMLRANGVPAKLVVVTDNNDIDREVTAYRPTHVIIEALWVIPSKLPVLRRLHPAVEWIVRIHSEIPFLAHEGPAMEWILEYLEMGIEVAHNSKRALTALRQLVPPVAERRLSYLPNYYPTGLRPRNPSRPSDSAVDIGCFGAVRPMKNQLIQAIAAILFARSRGLYLRFHMNGTRIEHGGSTVLRNLSALFARSPDAELVLHPWVNHREFTRLASRMDVAMQVSFSETFNIVSADCAARGIPLVVSPEISWVIPAYQAAPTSLESIKRTLRVAYDSRHGSLPTANFKSLERTSREAVGIWLRWLGGAGPWWVGWLDSFGSKIRAAGGR
jgi:hypothetical protein